MIKDESEIELLLKTTRVENKKFQEELKRLREEAKKISDFKSDRREISPQ